jgi:hypothetical protein
MRFEVLTELQDLSWYSPDTPGTLGPYLQISDDRLQFQNESINQFTEHNII